MKAAEDANYVMATTTEGTTDSVYNDCGIPYFHAFSILSVFTMTEADGTAHKVMLLRNPWARATYN